VKDLNGPWLMFDNKNDPYQMHNLVGNSKHLDLMESLDKILHDLLKGNGDEFLSGESYIRKWGYQVNENGTIDYTP